MAAQANNNNRKKRQEEKKPKQNALEAKTENQKNYIRSIVENEHGADEDAMSSSSTGMVFSVNIAEL